MKSYKGVRVLLHISWQLHAPSALLPKSSPRYPLDRILSRPQSRSEHCGIEKNILPLQVIENRQSGP
jgi:hypothetical protein